MTTRVMKTSGLRYTVRALPLALARTATSLRKACERPISHLLRDVIKGLLAPIYTSTMLIPNAAAMAMPVVHTLTDCADYNQVFEPFLPQLYTLPHELWAHITDPSALRAIYQSTNPVISALAFSIALFPILLVASEVNKNYSQVDRLWPILPSIYHAHYAIWARLNGLPTEKIDFILMHVLVWTTRLTYNYWRRGGYQIGSEDYRWNVVKGWIGQPTFFLLNIFFISSVQSLLLFAITTPAYLIMVSSMIVPEILLTDQVFAKSILFLVALEWIADGSQWKYQQAKDEFQKTKQVPKGYTRAQLERGFNTTGLFRYSRHPSFAAEQSIWVLVYVWGCVTTKSYYNWTIVAPISYLSIFAGSTPLTEYISSSKYPQYKLYQRFVGMFLPKLFSKGLDEKEMDTLAAKETGKKKR